MELGSQSLTPGVPSPLVISLTLPRISERVCYLESFLYISQFVHPSHWSRISLVQSLILEHLTLTHHSNPAPSPSNLPATWSCLPKALRHFSIAGVADAFVAWAEVRSHRRTSGRDRA